MMILMHPSHIVRKVEILSNKEKKIDFVTCNFNYFKGVSDHIVGEKCMDNIVHTADGHLLTSFFLTHVFTYIVDVLTTLAF